MKLAHFPVVFFLALTGCGGSEVRDNDSTASVDFITDQRPLGKTMVYQCSGYEFIARLGPGEMAIWLDDRYVILSQVRSASGVKYQEGDSVFWIKGDEAILSVDQQRYTDCLLIPERVPWEDARRRGVNFRAVGNEPGWYLEIQRGRQLLFVGDYGMQRVLVPDPGEVSLGAAHSYHSITKSNDLRVEIVDELCSDIMKGDSYPSQVQVYLNGRTYQGCGKSLNQPWK
ncbi:MAG: MliC family protein [Halioglobus sp.]